MRPGDPIITAKQMSRVILMLVVPQTLLAFTSVIAVRVTTDYAGYREGRIMALCVLALVACAVFLRWPDLLEPRRIPAGLAVAIVFITITVWWCGPILGAYVSMAYVWAGMLAHLLLERKWAFLMNFGEGIAYAVMLATASGNSAPVTRWVLVMGATTVSGLLVGGLSDRVFQLVDEEHELRVEVEEARQQFELADRQRSQFLAGMSHELRTPLNAVIGFSDVLAERLVGPLRGEQEALIERIRAAGARLATLVGEILDLDAAAGDGASARTAEQPTPPEEHEPLVRADPRGAAAFFLLVPLALVTFPRRPPGLDLPAVIAIAAVGLALDMWILLRARLRPNPRATAHIIVVTLVVFAIALSGGVTMAPYATMFFMWMATAASIRLSTRGAGFILVLIAACEALVVVLQHGNADPFVRWQVTVSTSTASALAVRAFVNRLFAAAARESELRHHADDARAALQNTERHKVEFLRHVRQELRIPMDEVTDAASRLAHDGAAEDGEGARLDAKQLEYAEDIAGAAGDLWELINDMLDLASVESGHMLVDLEEVPLGDLIREVADGFAGRIQCHVEPPGIVLPLDRDKLRRAIRGLVSNAVKFSPADDAVRVDARVADGVLMIAVADRGPGIAPQDRARIFEGFQQGRSNDAAPGAGVGLTLAQRFVELQGGRIELVSEPGQGSTFTIHMPVIEAPGLRPRKAPVA